MPTTISGSDGVDKVQDGVVVDATLNLTANSSEIKEAVNASGDAPIYACRAWVNFNGTGTPAIRGSGNVLGITDNGVGDYTIEFIKAMPDANYILFGTQKFNDDSQGIAPANVATPFLTTSARIYCLRNNGDGAGGILNDSELISVGFVR